MASRRPGPGELLAGASGLVVLLAMFLPWFGLNGRARVPGTDQVITVGRDNVSAWEAFSGIDVLLALVAVLAVAVLAVSFVRTPPPELVLATAATAALGALLIVFRLIDPPSIAIEDAGDTTYEVGRRIGAFIGLLGTAGIAWGAGRLSAEAAAAPTAATPAPAPTAATPAPAPTSAAPAPTAATPAPAPTSTAPASPRAPASRGPKPATPASRAEATPASRAEGAPAPKPAAPAPRPAAPAAKPAAPARPAPAPARPAPAPARPAPAPARPAPAPAEPAPASAEPAPGPTSERPPAAAPRPLTAWTRPAIDAECQAAWRRYDRRLGARYARYFERHPDLAGQQRTSARDLVAALPPGWEAPADAMPGKPWQSHHLSAKSSQMLGVGLLALAATRDRSLAWLWDALAPLPPPAEAAPRLQFAHAIDPKLLGERPRPTSFDVLVDDPAVLVGVETKWREHGVGSCRCRGEGVGPLAGERCSRSVERRQAYWDTAAEAFGLGAREPGAACPISALYEVIRRAAALRALAGDERPALLALIYDADNPYFTASGEWPGWPAVLERVVATEKGFRIAAIAWQELVPRLPLDEPARGWAADKHGLG